LRLLRGPKQYDELEIVGVVADSKYNTLGEDTRLLVYRPYRQAKMNFPTIHLKTAGAPATLIPGVRTALAGMDRTVVPELQTMQESLAFALIPSRIAAVLLGGMGTIGLALALTGLYGSLAYAVSRRTAEIGIRMALGASRGTVFAAVMRDAGLLIGAGLGIGGLLAFAASAPLSQFVAGVHVTDAGSLPAVAALMLLVGVAASYVPARRATKVDPIVALRYE
jgi:putative ABC transport system permease protein